MREAMGANAVPIVTQFDERFRRQEELGEEHRARKRVSAGTQSNESFLRLRDEEGDLLPGLPNHITLDHIVTKLPWTAFHVLSSVSHHWLQAIRSHKVHDVRIHYHSMDTLVVMTSSQYKSLSLYSMMDQHSYELPGTPPIQIGGIRLGKPDFCIALNGKLYVLMEECTKVYMLDLVEQRKWRHCARMKQGRHDFGYGSKDGKIYVFGGAYRYGHNPVRGCEVYDPEEDSWSQIASMEFWRHSHKVASLGEELFVYGGFLSGPGEAYQRHSRAMVFDAYHPIKNEWRRVGEHPSGGVFMARGKFHLMTVNTIHVYDHEENTWSHLHSIKLGRVAFYHPYSLYFDVVAVNDELLVAVMDGGGGYYRFRGKGLGGKDAEILFQREACRYRGIFEDKSFFPCTIQL